MDSSAEVFEAAAERLEKCIYTLSPENLRGEELKEFSHLVACLEETRMEFLARANDIRDADGTSEEALQKERYGSYEDMVREVYYAGIEPLGGRI